MGEMPAMRQIHGEDCITRFEKAEIDRLIHR